MRIPWNGDRCIVCLARRELTDEHLIPASIGGQLVVKFLCHQCNSTLGHRSEAAVISDPSLRLFANALSAKHPELAREPHGPKRAISVGPGGKAAGYIKDGQFVVKSHQKEDGSLIQPTPDARRSVERMLKRDGHDATAIQAALARFDAAQDNERVQIYAGIEVVKWAVTGLEPALDGPLLDSVVPIKTAFEFLACHLAEMVYDDTPSLNAIREILATGQTDNDVAVVERLYASTARPFHGIVFEGNEPCAQIQVRLYGQLAFRVRFAQLAVGGRRAQYTHDLVTDEEAIIEIPSGSQ